MMLSTLKQHPYYLLLLPVFFVLHGYLENFGFISTGNLIILCITYQAATIAIAVFFWFFFQRLPKTAFISFIVMSYVLFFGALHDFLKSHPRLHFFSSYKILLALFPILIICSFIYLKKTKKSFQPVNVFLNVLFLVYVMIEAAGVIIKTIHPPKNNLSVYRFAQKNEYKPCKTCFKPDIYFLLMDEYSSSASLKRLYQFENDLDSFLLQKKFKIQTNSRSNYNHTPFSMASILNMSYVEGLEKAKGIDKYTMCEQLIRNNEVIKLLNTEGYDIVNYSIFDLAGHPSIVKQSFLPLNTRLITERTLLSKVKKDLGTKLAAWYPFKWFWGKDLLYKQNDQKFIDLVIKSTYDKNTRPRFIYAHFIMPHRPFYFDKSGHLKDIRKIKEESDNRSPMAYLEYVSYANTQIKRMISAILHQKPSAEIILMGDHGLRTVTEDLYPLAFFQNLNAVYYPDNDYRFFYDSISGVNQYRVIFNKLFNKSITLAKDTSIYIR